MEDDEESVPPRILDAPNVIWLNYGDLERDDTHDNLSRAGDVTWCKDKQFDSDVCYVREDVSWLDRLKPKAVMGVEHMLTDDQLTALATLHLAGKNDGDTVQLLPLLRAVVAAERERLRGYFRDALADTGIMWPGEVDILYEKCFAEPLIVDGA